MRLATELLDQLESHLDLWKQHKMSILEVLARHEAESAEVGFVAEPSGPASLFGETA